jgi:sugar lactone lactonase YvrE
VNPQSQQQVGYMILSADPGAILPIGAALFSYTDSDGTLVSQAGVGAVQPLQSGRVFVDERGTQTGIALANTSQQPATVRLRLRDSSGSEVPSKSLTLGAGQHMATFVFQQFDPQIVGPESNFTGSLTFESDQKLAAITLRQNHNKLDEPLYTTLPVADPSAAPSQTPMVFPQIAAGDNYVTQLILLNTSSGDLSGTMRFTASDGTPLLLRLNGEINSSFKYSIKPQGTYSAELDRPAGLGVGYAVITPDAGMAAPAGSAVFQFKVDGSVVTEAGVGASPSTTQARIYVDNAASYTGVAIASATGQPAEVLFTLLDSAGFTLQTTTRTLAAGGHLAIFAHELFPGLSNTFTGLMQLQSSTPLNPITLKLTTNKRNEPILTTLPVADMTRPPSVTSAVFPQIALGGGFSTRLIFINSTATSSTGGKLTFYQSDATLMNIPFAGKTGSQFPYQFIAGGGRQYSPGSDAAVAQIALLDPVTSAPSNEVVVNEGNSVHGRLLVLDSSGTPREDFDVGYSSLSPEIATVDSYGVIKGKSAGFSTLTVTAGGALAAGTITVVKVDAGAQGFEIQGIAQDASRRLYLAATQAHTILLAQSLQKTPGIYAGRDQQAGLKDDLRQDSLFKNPAYLAFNQGDGNLYVGDAGNHAIRRVHPGSAGKVETAAGTGVQGSDDGSVSQARFNGPQGVALDNRGYLWVADTGNHTIRRVNLIAGRVETLAGRAGIAGSADGTGALARFNSPSGIAVEAETVAEQLEREMKGLPPPPVTVIVADQGNGLIRRVKETGEVQTIGAGGSQDPGGPRDGHRYAVSERAVAAVFDGPTGVAVDLSGNIFVSEASTGRVKAILRNGSVVAAVQEGTFSHPRGIAATEGGRVVVADSQRYARQIGYGTPQIVQVNPGRIGNKGGDTVTIKGKNFATDSEVFVAGIHIAADIRDTETLVFAVPILPNGIATITVINRGGLGQNSIFVEPAPLKSLPAGIITTVAGGTTFAGEGEAATVARIADPEGLALDPAGNLYIADSSNDRVRRVDAKTGIITTIAGSGIEGFSGDGLQAVAAQFRFPTGMALHPSGDLLIADYFNNRVRRVSAATGTIATVAGTGTDDFSGDDGPATNASLSGPAGVAVDSAGNIFVADWGNDRVRKIDAATGTITTVAGGGKDRDNVPATQAKLWGPNRITFDPAGNMLFADDIDNKIRKVDRATGIITTVAGNGGTGFSGDGGKATDAMLYEPEDMAFDGDGNLYIADAWNFRIRRVDARTGFITTIAGTGHVSHSGDGGPAALAAISRPEAIVVDAAGNVLFADRDNNCIRRIDAFSGSITTVAGTGSGLYGGDGGPAAAAVLNSPRGVSMTAAGDIYIADTFNSRVRKVDASTGVITTVAGIGIDGFSGEGGSATTVALSWPWGIHVTPEGTVAIADFDNNRVRRFDPESGMLATVAGSGPAGLFDGSFDGDGGPATAARLDHPMQSVMDKAGNLLLADSWNHRIRRVDATGIITTVAGGGMSDTLGDGGPATAAYLESPEGLAVDTNGDLYISDNVTHRVRKVDNATGIITTFAGTGVSGFSGDGGPAAEAQLAKPYGMALDGAGHLYIADSENYRIRRIDLASGIITTVAGTGVQGFAGDNASARGANLNLPYAVAMDAAGNLYIADAFNNRIRAIRGPIP